MKLSLGEFQDAFVEALYQRPAPALAALTEQAAFSVYRNTVISGCVDALCANFPAVNRLVGSHWMRDAAAAYAECSPPCDVRLIHYGAAFPAFLEGLPSAQGLPYLADVARLDFYWTEVFSAAAEPWLALADLAGISATELAHSRLRPRRGLRWQWFESHPVFSLWHCSREGLAWSQQQPWVAEGALLSADDTGVDAQALTLAGCIFLDGCAAGLTLEQAAGLAEQACPELDFNDLLARLFQARVFLPLTIDRG